MAWQDAGTTCKAINGLHNFPAQYYLELAWGFLLQTKKREEAFQLFFPFAKRSAFLPYGPVGIRNDFLLATLAFSR